MCDYQSYDVLDFAKYTTISMKEAQVGLEYLLVKHGTLFYLKPQLESFSIKVETNATKASESK